MRRFLSALLLLSAPWVAVAADSQSAAYSARVVRAVSGDALIVEAPGHIATIRLYGVQCPQKGQPGAEQAAWFTNNAAMDGVVYVTERGAARNGLVYAEVTLRDGRDLGKSLVKYGHAWWSAKSAPEDADLEQLETSARERRVGLWADSNPLPPWEWRRSMRRESSRAERFQR